jgi:hypothetical protein
VLLLQEQMGSPLALVTSAVVVSQRASMQDKSFEHMRSKQLNLDAYGTDKIKLGYLDVYDPILVPWLDKEIKVLELGVYQGRSLELWRDYFPRATIVGIDLELPDGFVPGGRIKLFRGSQADTRFLSEVAAKTAPNGFDIIIDDASHIGELTKTAFWHLFNNHLKRGGLYAIEDWGTGYLDDFPDGRKFNAKVSILGRIGSLLPRRLSEKIKVPAPCHSYGMVGFIKELVDEQGAASIAMGRKAGWRLSKFQNLLITPGIVFVTKATPTITACPNPVLIGSDPGNTRISWSTIDPAAKVFVSVDGCSESLFATSCRGSITANWIRRGHNYEFRLYDSAHQELLAKTVVTTAVSTDNR